MNNKDRNYSDQTTCNAFGALNVVALWTALSQLSKQLLSSFGMALLLLRFTKHWLRFQSSKLP
jgi:hypothetical protein